MNDLNFKNNLNSQSRHSTNRLFFGFFILFLLCWVLFLFQSYLLTISIGVLLAVATSNIHNAFLRFTNGKAALSAAITTLFLCTVFFLPLIYAVIEIVKNAANFDIKSISHTIDYIKNFDLKLPQALSFLEPKIKELIAGIDLPTLIRKVLSYAKGSLEKSANFLIDISFIMLFLFFSHFYANFFKSYIKKVSPIAKYELEAIFLEVANTMSVVFYSTIANMILQGFLFAIIASFYGFDGLLFGVLFAFSSLIPVVGGALVYIPLSVFEFSLGDTKAAIIILVYSIVVISTLADNFVKPLVIKFINEKLLKTPAKMNELLIFFSMLAGLSSFGFWGIVLGPAIVTLLSATLRVYAMLKSSDLDSKAKE